MSEHLLQQCRTWKNMSPFVKFIMVFLSVQPFNSAAPTNNSSNEVDCENGNTYSSIYDQRQNGTENVRVNVKDVFLVWAPEGQLGNPGLLDSDFLDYPNEEVPQKPTGSNEVEKPTSIIDILNSFQELAASSSPRPEIGNTSSEASIVSSNSNSTNSVNGTSTEDDSHLTPSKTKRSKYRPAGIILPLFRRRYRAD